jgi:hypothetical protein
VISGIIKLQKELEENKQSLLKAGELQACRLGMHLFQPLFHVKKGGKINVLPTPMLFLTVSFCPGQNTLSFDGESRRMKWKQIMCSL